MVLPFLRRRRPSERLSTSFRWLEQKPFPVTNAKSYSARYERGAYVLTLAKDSYFAWEGFSSGQQFTDFVLEAQVELDPANGHSAVGVLFRRVNDENFYSLLLSSRGNYRVDLLFNNHPMHLVEWTRLAELEGGGRPAGSRDVRIVAHGSRFTIVVDDEWVAEVEDEVLPSGGIGFGAQNFAGAGEGVFRMRKLVVEAHPLAVEREHLRWSYYMPVSPAARLRLAETYVGAGRFSTAAVQLRKALKEREGSVQEHFLLAECYARLSLYEEALAHVQIVLAREPGHAEAKLEKANLLYLSNRLLEARDSLLPDLEDHTKAPAAGAWNLLGNIEYGLGNWDKAAEAYTRVVQLQPEMPLFLRNAARALERAGHSVEAVEMYLHAARLLFTEEAFDELSLVIPRVRALSPENPEVLAMEAKTLYREGKIDEAFGILMALEEKGTEDSAVHYLLGIILSSRGRREEALPRLARAAELEPAFPLYQFRLAETLHALGRDPGPLLDNALVLAPDDPWTNNLAGKIRIEAGDPGGAVLFLRKARAAAPAEQDICLNLSEALSLSGRHEEALQVIDSLSTAAEGSASAANQRGNILARQGESERAVHEYESAIRLDPKNIVYKENCAAACLAIDMVHRAEELLAQVEPEHPSPSVYNLLGRVALLKGERARAELAFQAGLAMDPGNPDLTVDLAMLHNERGNHGKAKELLLSVLSAAPGHALSRRLLERLRDEHERRLACAVCEREWWVPKDLPPQPTFRVRGEPPAEAPAGRCPQCGKIYCIGCASSHLKEMRFFCPECGEFLKLSDDALKWLVARYIEGYAGRAGTASP
jgi:tetratricopeptide (TPR) repeat protein